MKAPRLSRKIHKWFALLLGIQLFIWALSGFYMVAVHIDIIHGDMLVNNVQRELNIDQNLYVPLDQLTASYPDARKITLRAMTNRPVYLVEGETTRLLDAVDGRELSPINGEMAAQIATYYYRGDANTRGVTLIESDPPTELQTRPLPLWRVDFDDKWNSTFYVDPTTGEFTTRRHTLWRIFDFFWMLHIMDYDTRDDMNNAVLQVFSVLGLLAGLSGVWLLLYSFRGKQTRSEVG